MSKLFKPCLLTCNSILYNINIPSKFTDQKQIKLKNNICGFNTWTIKSTGVETTLVELLTNNERYISEENIQC